MKVVSFRQPIGKFLRSNYLLSSSLRLFLIHFYLIRNLFIGDAPWNSEDDTKLMFRSFLPRRFKGPSVGLLDTSGSMHRENFNFKGLRSKSEPVLEHAINLFGDRFEKLL